MLNLNLREDLYPEYPIIDGCTMQKRIKNVFENWKEDKYEQIVKAF